jgi:FtsH-binding integral membrane protein
LTVNNRINLAQILSFLTAFLLGLVFAATALLYRNSERIYSNVDIAAGALFVLVLSLMISLLLWPIVLEKYVADGGSDGFII